MQRVKARASWMEAQAVHVNKVLSRGGCLGRCLVDTQPRRLSVDDYRVLNNCAEMVVRRLEREVFAHEHMGAAHQVRCAHVRRTWAVRSRRSCMVARRLSFWKKDWGTSKVKCGAILELIQPGAARHPRQQHRS